MTEIGKKILLGNGDVVTITGKKEGYFITDGKYLKNIEVPINVDVYNKDGIDYISVKKDEQNKQEYQEYDQLTQNTNYLNKEIYISIKKRTGKFLVVKTTEKTVHFYDHENDHKKRYVSFKNVKSVYKKQ